MSGRKRATVTISREEYRRLHEAEMRLLFMNQEDAVQVEKVKQESAANTVRQMEELNIREQEFHNLVAGLGEHIRRVEEKTSQALYHQQYELWRQMQQTAGELSSRRVEMLEAQEQRMAAAMREERKRHRGQLERMGEYFVQLQSDHDQRIHGLEQVIAQQGAHFDDRLEMLEMLLDHERTQRLEDMAVVQSHLDAMESERMDKGAYADMWLNAAIEMSNYIEEHLQHEFFAPGRMDGVLREINLAGENLANGFCDSALLQAQRAYMELSDLRIELEQLHNTWEYLRQSVIERLLHLKALAESNRSCEAVDAQGNMLGFTLDVDEWTEGGLSCFREKVDHKIRMLDDSTCMVEIDALRRMLKEELPGMEKELAGIILDARLAVLNSQLRINIADIVIQALRRQGFGVVDAGYQQRNLRATYIARLKNLEGSEVQVRVIPGSAKYGDNELQLDSLDYRQRTQYELRQRAKEISSALARFGLQIGTVSAPQPVTQQTSLRSQSISENEVVAACKPLNVSVLP
ncbi:MAG: hypothetical protein HPY45_05395 [Anaerolineae bacterium]|nr:hypothetical protein [Anaerolineae bacterium]